MAANGTLLCIHRNPAQLSLLEENGYELVTATNGHDGLRLFFSRTVDAIVIEHHLGVMAHADWLIDLGPGAGRDGGRIIFEGTPAELVAASSTLTGEHLAAYVSG